MDRVYSIIHKEEDFSLQEGGKISLTSNFTNRCCHSKFPKVLATWEKFDRLAGPHNSNVSLLKIQGHMEWWCSFEGPQRGRASNRVYGRDITQENRGKLALEQSQMISRNGSLSVSICKFYKEKSVVGHQVQKMVYCVLWNSLEIWSIERDNRLPQTYMFELSQINFWILY